jgi:uncharacterized protein
VTEAETSRGRTERARATIDRFLAAAVSEHPGDMADCYAERVVIELPFTGGLVPDRIETTRDELRNRFDSGAALRRYDGIRDVHVHQTADPEIWVVEFRLDGAMTETGEPFSIAYALVMTIRDGLVVHSRDYNDMIVGARLLGRVPELVDHLTRTTIT